MLNPSDPAVSSHQLAELSEVINQSSVARQIVNKSRRVRSIEQTCGPSMRTRTLHQEIARLEDILMSMCEGYSGLKTAVS